MCWPCEHVVMGMHTISCSSNLLLLLADQQPGPDPSSHNSIRLLGQHAKAVTYARSTMVMVLSQMLNSGSPISVCKAESCCLLKQRALPRDCSPDADRYHFNRHQIFQISLWAQHGWLALCFQYSVHCCAPSSCSMAWTTCMDTPACSMS